ncbi:hypothetical protein [Streptomyces sp. NPDC048650]|uniref:hypothetical protein n=1 Tax=unclassified Streptomyces TaxID=2593676 RepID=UPI00371614D8
MLHCIARVLEPLMRPRWPSPARHRSQQRARRRALWPALHGIDIGPRLIHGVEVIA